MSIEMVKCRATVVVGGTSVSTPYVQSFNVRKQRGQVSTFDATVKIAYDAISESSAGGPVVIYAGAGGANKLIFTGVCRQAKISPCFDDPYYVILSISGGDTLSLLNGKKYTRRCRASLAAWVGITGVVREGLRSGKFAYSNEPTIITDGGKTELNNNMNAHIGGNNIMPTTSRIEDKGKVGTVSIGYTIETKERPKEE
jgi:N-acetylmuramoyl-L-alanine amidase